MKYVLGFLFDPSGNKVALIKKESPAWQAGRLNGIGGKLEFGEPPHAGMIREFEEETGVRIEDWQYFGLMYSDKDEWEATLFVASSSKIDEVRTVTNEEVLVFYTDEAMSFHGSRAISNVPYLVAIAKDSLFNQRGPQELTLEY